MNFGKRVMAGSHRTRHALAIDHQPHLDRFDAQHYLALALPKQASSSSGSSGGSGSSGAATTGTTGTTGATGGSSGSSSGSSSSSTPSPGSPTSPSMSLPAGTPIPLAAGVIGGLPPDQIVIFTSRTPDPRAVPVDPSGNPLDPEQYPVPCDIRRISYWLGSNGGLCRQEMPWFSSDNFVDSNSITYENGKSDDDYVIAPEVDSLQFEYYDINTTGGDDSGWSDTWDGSQPGLDGVTPWGPPTAIRVSFSIKNPDGKSESKQYRHVIPLVTASGPTTSPNGIVEQRLGKRHDESEPGNRESCNR